jgi:hypothetical protein
LADEYYLGVLEAEASSPSAREVATVLEGLARRAHRFARELFSLDIRMSNEGPEAFNTANEAAADILANISIKPENRSVLDAALRANEFLAAVAVREARKLAEGSKKGRRVHGHPTAWMLRQLAGLLRDNGLSISLPPKWDEPYRILSEHFLRIALTRAKALRRAGVGMRGNQDRAHAQRAIVPPKVTASRAASRGKFVTDLTLL